MTGIPIDIRWFFGIENLQSGGREEITLLFNGKPYYGVIVMGVQDHPRSRLTWRADFAKEMSKRFPKEYNLFKSGSNEANEIYMNFYKKTSNLLEVCLQ